MRSFTGMPGTSLSGLGNVVPGLAPSAAIRAKKCHFPRSSWVHAFILTCDDKLAVWFKRRPRHRRRAAAGGVPGVCCLYPQSTRRLYDLAIVWWSAGHFVHRFLYRVLAYVPVAPPKAPCGTDCPPGVVVGCCPNALPELLHATVAGGGAVNGSYAIAWDAVSATWKYQGAFGTCGGPGSTTLSLLCVGTQWQLGGAFTAAAIPETSHTCAPLAITFAGVDMTNCGGSAAATVTVTT